MQPPKSLVLALSLLTAGALAQTVSDLRNDVKSTGDVLTYGMGWDQSLHSPLKQVSKSTIKRLVPVWSLSLDSSGNAATQPLVVGDKMFVSTYTHTIAIDVRSGRQLWKETVDLPADATAFACCGAHSRGMAAFDGVLYRPSLDAHVTALSMADGKVIWKSKAGDYKQGITLTSAPLVAGNVLITGMAGGEYGTRGFLTGWDLKTGEKKWQRWTTAVPGEPGGDTWTPGAAERGGAPTWTTGSYDPELDLVFWGTGNATPFNPTQRGGDSLYAASILAIRPSTGEIVWHYQCTPGDPFDYDAVAEPVMAELPINGRPTKVLMQANKNGFFYVLERATGKLLSAHPFAKKISWAKGVDMKTGRPILTALGEDAKRGEALAEIIDLWPGQVGAKNWSPMSWDSKRALVYINTIRLGNKLKYLKEEYKPGVFNMGMDFDKFAPIAPEDGFRGALTAWNPVTGKAAWEVPTKTPFWSGVLSTDGGVVFTGAQTGEFMAFDSDTGKKLWQFQAGAGIAGVPITWEKDGRQYITVTTGTSNAYGLFQADPNPDLKNTPSGGAVWTFALVK